MAETRLPKYLGLRLKQAGLISTAQIQIALQDRIQYNHLELEEILSLRGWLKPETIDFFANQISKLIKRSQKISLIKSLKQAALLSEEDIKNLIKIHQETGIVFQDLLVNLGYIKESTLEFFEKYLVNNKTDITGKATKKEYKSFRLASVKKSGAYKKTVPEKVKNSEFFDPKVTSSLKISLPRQSFLLSLRLNQAGLISESQIEVALQDCQRYNNFTLEEVFNLHGWISPKTLDFFKEKFPQLIANSKSISLAECLEAAGLLSEERKAQILEYQKISGRDFYSLARELAAIEPVTLDFFLNYIVDDKLENYSRHKASLKPKKNPRFNNSISSENRQGNNNNANFTKTKTTHWSEAKTIIGASPLSI